MCKENIITGVAMQRFCECVKELRELGGWTRRQISNAAGIGSKSIAAIEQGYCGITKTRYATLRFIFQASLYDMSEEDAQMFSYVLETLLDPSTTNTTFIRLRDKVRAAVSDSYIVSANAVHDLFVASANHHIKYTSDPDGLDWYYDLVGLPLVSKRSKRSKPLK